MGKRYPRAWKKRYKDKRDRAQAKLVADRLMGKRKETLFQSDNDWKWQSLKSRQLGMSMINSYYNIANPRWNAIITGIEGV